MPEISKERPTVGRKLWFYSANSEHFNGGCWDIRQPFDATVIFPGKDNTEVSVRVTDHAGVQHTFHFLSLYDPTGDDSDSHGNGSEGCETYLTWMPYQKKQQDEKKGAEAPNSSDLRKDANTTAPVASAVPSKNLPG